MRIQHCAGKEWLGLHSRASSPGNGLQRAEATHSSSFRRREEEKNQRIQKRKGKEARERQGGRYKDKEWKKIKHMIEEYRCRTEAQGTKIMTDNYCI